MFNVEIKNIPAIQILREIKKCPFSTISKALNFYFGEFMQFSKTEICQKSKFRAYKTVKMAVFETLKDFT